MNREEEIAQLKAQLARLEKENEENKAQLAANQKILDQLKVDQMEEEF